MLLDHKLFLVKERVAVMKLTDTYDILDPETQQKIGVAKEEVSGAMKGLRLFMDKTKLPTTINIYEDENQPPVFSIHRPFKVVRAKVEIVDQSGTKIGYLMSKLMSIRGGFYAYDMTNKQIAEVKGDWAGWNFQIVGEGDKPLGTVTKKWAGIGKELFTTADTYIIALEENMGSHPATAMLLLAAGLAIDIVFREK
jgi:uncharacterized protein YxjI